MQLAGYATRPRAGNNHFHDGLRSWSRSRRATWLFLSPETSKNRLRKNSVREALLHQHGLTLVGRTLKHPEPGDPSEALATPDGFVTKSEDGEPQTRDFRNYQLVCFPCHAYAASVPELMFDARRS